MSASRATLRVSAAGCTPTAELAAAQAPQRWNLCTAAQDGWLEVTHQVMGDGFFGGDLATTRVSIGPAAKAIVRGVSATPLRRGCSAAVTRLNIAGGQLLWLPGPLVPHRNAKHSAGVDIRMSAGSETLFAATLLLGRTGWGEVASFRELRFRTRLRYDAELAIKEDITVTPGSLVAVADSDRYEAFVSLLAIGPRLGSLSFECSTEECLVGSSQLRAGGTAVRALFPHLGAALEFLGSVERRARVLLDEPPQGRC